MRWQCDNCSMEFDDPEDCEGNSCGQCEDGTICRDIDDLSDEEVDIELERRGISADPNSPAVQRAMRTFRNLLGWIKLADGYGKAANLG